MNFEDIYKQALKEDEGAANTSTAGGSSSITSAAPEKPINPDKLNESEERSAGKIVDRAIEELGPFAEAAEFEDWIEKQGITPGLGHLIFDMYCNEYRNERKVRSRKRSLNESEENETSNSIVVHNGDEEINLQEATLTRLQKRKLLNKKLFEAIDTKSLKKNFDEISSLKESTFDAAKSWILYEKEEEKKGRNSPRYKIQSWTNGGGGDNSEKGQPSEYEAWRAGIVDKRRKARLEQELSDATSPFKSPTTTDISNPTLDNQEDQFLSWWIEKHGGKK
jgi:hypothetical protein